MLIVEQISWRKFNLFLQCQRCFYKEQCLQMKRPETDPDCFSLNNAVDTLWKRELDACRTEGVTHPLFFKHKINAVPFVSDKIDDWRDYKRGIRVADDANNFELYGVIDDVLINDDQELVVIDYKTTANPVYVLADPQSLRGKVNKRQLSFYAYLLRKSGYKMANVSYIVCNLALCDRPAFQQSLEFESSVSAYPVDYLGVENTLRQIRCCLDKASIPCASSWCKYCSYELGEKK